MLFVNKNTRIMKIQQQKVALITGASQGLGLAIAEDLIQKGWTLLINARNAQRLREAQKKLEEYGQVFAISGDVRDEIHLLQFAELLERESLQLDLVINNASTLGASPQPELLRYEIDAIHQIYHTNVIAPLSLLQKVRPYLSPAATIINISSDAAVEAYEGWGGYGASKAALDHWTAILAKEQPQWHIYAFDPGDMRTAMHQAAFPDEDISDRPLPEEVAVPTLLKLITQQPESGRYVAGKWPPPKSNAVSATQSLTLLK
jgi:NAD(P)-dependent dehydrogenase (short-subunit alcohol dehydrogenase family)